MPVPAKAETMTERQLETEYERALERARGRLTIGTRIGESAEGYLDILQPILSGENSLIFLNPKLSGSDNDEEEISIGLGARLLIPDHGVIFGANIFYDERRTSRDNTFDQIGAGVEMLTEWVDARANYYWPEDKQREIDRRGETDVDRQSFNFLSDIYAQQHQLLQDQTLRTVTTTTSREFVRYEAPLEGFDAEVGIRLPGLPEWLETRVFGGYYKFRGDFTEDIKGVRGRLEVRALPALFLDAEVYEDKKLTGSDYFVGARVNVPFDLANLARGRNPFAGITDDVKAGRREFRERMSEMIIRDPHVRIHESGFMEDVAVRDVKTEVRGSSQTLLVLDDVNFVDNQSAGPGDGTAENPYPTVQQGVDNVFGLKNVYVFPGAGPYRENIVIAENGVQLLGSGKGIQGFGGKVFGGAIYPVLDGNVAGVNSPVIRVFGDDVLIQGFDIARSPGGANPGAIDFLGYGINVDRIGILAENANNLNVMHNRFRDQVLGMTVLMDGYPFYNATIANNDFTTGMDAAIFGAVRNSAQVDLNISDNRISDAVLGIELYAYMLDDVNLTLSGNRIADPASYGIYMEMGPTINNVDVLLTGNEVFGAGVAGAELKVTDIAGDVSISLQNERYFDNNAGFNLDINQVGGDVDVSVIDSHFNGSTGGAGFNLLINDVGGDVSVYIDPTEFNNNAANGLFGNISVEGNISVVLEDVTANNNSAGGVFLSLFSQTGVVQTLFRGVEANDNGGDGVSVTASSDEFVIFGQLPSLFSLDEAVANRITANNNAGSGISMIGNSVSGAVIQISDLLVANGNSGNGVAQILVAEQIVMSLVNEIEASNNSGNGAFILVNSSLGGAFIDIGRANVNSNAGGSGLFLSANSLESSVVSVGMGETLLGGLPKPNPGPVVANDNMSQGIYAGLSSVSGSVIFIAQDIETKRNQSGGVDLMLLAHEDIQVLLGAGLVGTNLIVGTVHADNNNGPGIQINANAEVGDVGINLVNGTANSNVVGVLVNAIAGEDVRTFIGAGILELSDANPVFGSFRADGNSGGPGMALNLNGLDGDVSVLFAGGGANNNAGDGLAAVLHSGHDVWMYMGGGIFGSTSEPLTFNNNQGSGISAVMSATNDTVSMISGGLELNNNVGSGLNLNVNSLDNANIILGISSLGTNSTTAKVSANDNAGLGISISAVSEQSVTVAIPLVEANRNNTGGILLNANAISGDTTVMLGLTPVPVVMDTDAFSVNASDNQGFGILAFANSISGEVNVVLGQGSVTNNAGPGINLFSSAESSIQVFMGVVFETAQGSGSLNVSDNIGGGALVQLISNEDDTSLITGALDLNNNNGVGMNVFMNAGRDAQAFLGVSSAGGTNLQSAQINANNNQGLGLNMTLSAGNDVQVSMADVTATNNMDTGIFILGSAVSNLNMSIGNLSILGSPFDVPGQIDVSGNDGYGLYVLAMSAGGASTVRVANVTANGNLGGVLVTPVSGNNNVTLDMENITANNNTEYGLIAIGAGEDVGINLYNITTISNGIGGMNVQANGTTFGSLGASNIVASFNQGTGALFLARGGDIGVVNVNQITASGNTAGHGVLAAVDHSATGLVNVLDATVDDNSRYGVVALVVATNFSSIAFNLISSDGNGLGPVYTDFTHLATNWYEIQP